ncbi:hypothetical protein [Helicobacter salomonis]|uniref:hypothetical protein n=1 Tax=Helicobacter salomonis TaxID=56878 RepID=UPI000CF14884|nr:hypothetical protein [Helicobacter salomonis]
MQSIISVDEAEDFISHLQKFTDDLNSMFRDLHAHFHALGDTWSDPLYLQFEEALKKLEASLACFDTEATEQIAWLRRCIDSIEIY